MLYNALIKSKGKQKQTSLGALANYVIWQIIDHQQVGLETVDEDHHIRPPKLIHHQSIVHRLFVEIYQPHRSPLIERSGR